MRCAGVIAAALLALTAGAFGQSMMKSAGAGTGVGGMTASNILTADTKVGHELRVAKGTGRKVIFTSLEDAQSLAAKGPVVLFFAADWCPNCQADLIDINANGNKIPDVTVVVVDYDAAKDLAKTYGVTVQDTFVQIDAKGNRLGIWNGGGVDLIMSRLVRG